MKSEGRVSLHLSIYWRRYIAYRRVRTEDVGAHSIRGKDEGGRPWIPWQYWVHFVLQGEGKKLNCHRMVRWVMQNDWVLLLRAHLNGCISTETHEKSQRKERAYLSEPEVDVLISRQKGHRERGTHSQGVAHHYVRVNG